LAELVVYGGRSLRGRVRASGRKNSAVAVLPAALLSSTPTTFENLPEIDDVKVYAEIMAHLGARVERLPGGHVSVSAAGARLRQPPQELAKKLRASYYLLGVMLARFGRAEVGLPGGCDIGLRPIDQHVKGLEALGARVVIEHGVIKAAAESLKAAVIYLDVVSVGATINIMLAATAAEGVTIIENAAKEPHVVDLANFLNAMGGRVVGAGTDVIKVHGGRELRGVEHSIIPDEIEAATYMMAGAGTRGDIIVENVIPKHLDPITAKLREMGAFVEENGDYIRVGARSRLKAANVKTLPYPGFPTDAQQQITPLLSVAEGTSIVTETVFENRFRHVDELKRMGTNIKVEGRTAIIEGVEALSGASVRASDLRAGAALVIAGLMARGKTVIQDIEHVGRGYEHLEEKLKGLGARVELV